MSSQRDFSHGAIIRYRYSVPTELVRDHLNDFIWFKNNFKAPLGAKYW